MIRIHNLFVFLLLSTLSCVSEEENENINTSQNLNITHSVARLGQSRNLKEVADVYVYPNPFNSVTNIAFHNSKKSKLLVTISDEKGKFTKFDEVLDGHSIISLEFADKPAGVYLCEILVNDKVERIYLYHL